MAHWDTSALLKLYVAEPDSAVFEGLVVSPPVTAFIARHEARAMFHRREGEGALAVGEAAYGLVLRQCLLHSPPVFVRTNDALHLAAAMQAGEIEFVTADVRQRAAARHLGFNVLP